MNFSNKAVAFIQDEPSKFVISQRRDYFKKGKNFFLESLQRPCYTLHPDLVDQKRKILYSHYRHYSLQSLKIQNELAIAENVYSVRIFIENYGLSVFSYILTGIKELFVNTVGSAASEVLGKIQSLFNFFWQFKDVPSVQKLFGFILGKEKFEHYTKSLDLVPQEQNLESKINIWKDLFTGLKLYNKVGHSLEKIKSFSGIKTEEDEILRFYHFIFGAEKWLPNYQKSFSSCVNCLYLSEQFNKMDEFTRFLLPENFTAHIVAQTILALIEKLEMRFKKAKKSIFRVVMGFFTFKDSTVYKKVRLALLYSLNQSYTAQAEYLKELDEILVEHVKKSKGQCNY